jgi:hypothetical protein
MRGIISPMKRIGEFAHMGKTGNFGHVGSALAKSAVLQLHQLVWEVLYFQ